MSNTKKYIKKKKLLKIPPSFAASIIDLVCPRKYSPNTKYSTEDLFVLIVDFLKSGLYWTNYRGTKDIPLNNGRYLNSIHNKWCKNNVYEKIHKEYLKIYLKKGKEEKLKTQIIDSSFIQNKGGFVNHQSNIIKENHKGVPQNIIQFNRYNGRKKYLKVSAITNSDGAIFSTKIVPGKKSDCVTITETLYNIPIDLNTLKNSKINRYKQYFLADSIYYSKRNITFLKKRGYIPVIKYNRKNTKDKKIIKANKFTKKEQKIYKKRIIIESAFSWLKNFPVICQNYQKTISSYNGLLKLASIIMLEKKL